MRKALSPREILIAARGQWITLLLGLLVLIGLFAVSQFNYLLFHSLAELFSIVIGVTIFVLTWNARRIIDNGYLLIIGDSFLFVSILDLLHTLAFRGMAVFPATAQGQPNAANLATQFWLCARFVQALSLIIAPFFLRRKSSVYPVLAGIFAFSILLLVALAAGIFPNAFLDNVGMTPFKLGSEYVIIALYLIAMGQLFYIRGAFDEDVLRLLVFSIAFNVGAELAFTEYIQVSDVVNLLGHFLKIVSFYLIYKAIIELGFLKPHDLLFRELTQSEQALRASEARERARAVQLEAIMDGVPAVVWIAHDREAHNVTGNRESSLLLGLPPNANHSRYAPEVANRIKFYDAEGSPISVDGLPMHRVARTGEAMRDFEELVVSNDGSTRHLYGSVVPILDEQGQPAGSVGAFIDITARVLAEQAMQESEQSYRGLFQAMSEAFSLNEIIYDDQGNAVDYTVLELNPVYERIAGMKREQMVGKTFRQIAPGVRPAWVEHFAQVAETGEPLRFQDYSPLLERYFDVQVYRTGERQVAVLATDVTEQLLSRKSLEESEGRMRRLVDADIIGVIYSGTDGAIITANDAFLSMIGYNREEFDGGRVNWREITPEEYLPVDEFGIAEATQRGACTPYEKEYIRKDGTRVPILIGYAYFEKEAKPFFIAFIVDLSEQKRAEAAIKEYAERMERLNNELERANRELQDFAFVASHDLQEPLRKIQAFGDRLTSRLGANLDEESRDYLIRMGNASQRMRAMINDLLALSRITTRGQPFEYISLEEVAREVISDLELRIESTGGQVEMDTLPDLQADPVQMHQLLQNLIINALKFHKPDTKPQVHVFGECNTEQQKAIIYVKDNGIGFDEQYLDRIFQPFQRLNGMGQYEGSGIGLAVCRKIVERHNGTITAHSKPGEGSTFIITLPTSAGKK